MLSQKLLQELFVYDPETGVLSWRQRTGRGARNDRTGLPAGGPHKDGYLAIQIGPKKYLAHRLVWLFHTGNFPEFIDHKNGVRTDNKFSNLRPATRRLNSENRRVETRGSLGIDFHRAAGKWRARITAFGVCHTLGHYVTAEEAQAAYLEAKRELHAGCTI